MIEIGPVIKNAVPPMRKQVFGDLEVGDMRVIKGDIDELRSWQISASWVGREFGFKFLTRIRGNELRVYRIA